MPFWVMLSKVVGVRVDASLYPSGGFCLSSMRLLFIVGSLLSETNTGLSIIWTHDGSFTLALQTMHRTGKL